ncbi:MAG: CCA tRNA nucleotidyltransferase [Lachnospiraceae bacterium]
MASNRKIAIPTAVLEILEQLNRANHEAYIVGGCVRDFLLGKEPSDWDITTSAKPQQVKALFRRTIDTGIAHGTVTIMKGNVGYEVTTYRIDGEYEDARHPKEVTFTASLEEDLKRRDFTMNAMAYHPEKGLVDIFGGEEDLNRGIIRCVGNAKERFTEDALRMMRAIRFAAQLNYEIDEETFQAIRELAPSISKVSAERIQVEMTKALISQHPGKFRLFYEAGLTAYFFPEFDRAMETNQNHPHHCYSVGEHLLHAVEQMRPDKVLRLSMLLHDIGKPYVKSTDEEGITHFYGHPKVSEEKARQILRRLKWDNDTIRKVCTYTRYHDYRMDGGETAIRRAIAKIGEEFFPDIFEVQQADVMAQSNYKREEKLAIIEKERELYLLVKEKEQCVSLKTLAVGGRDLIALGVAPGKGLGVILNGMLEDVLEHPEHNTREYLLEVLLEKL